MKALLGARTLPFISGKELAPPPPPLGRASLAPPRGASLAPPGGPVWPPPGGQFCPPPGSEFAVPLREPLIRKRMKPVDMHPNAHENE